jgi:hypothetical protein
LILESPLNLGMVVEERSSSSDSIAADGTEQSVAPGPSGHPAGGPSEFVRSYLSPVDLQVSHIAVLNIDQ